MIQFGVCYKETSDRTAAKIAGEMTTLQR